MDDAQNASVNGNDPGSINQNVSNYTIEGVIHFLQLELIKIESQRSKWELEKTELQAQLAFFQGERQGQEKLKKDLVRRIKMLEFALKQERNRSQATKFEGNENLPLQKINHNKQPEILSPAQKLAAENSKTVEYNTKWRSSRERLLQILNEVKCTDTYLDKSQPKMKQLFMNSLGSDSEESALRTLDNLDNELDKNSALVKNFNQITSSSGRIGNKVVKNGELSELIELLAVGVDELNKNRQDDGDASKNIGQENDHSYNKKSDNFQNRSGMDLLNNYELGDLNRISVVENNLNTEDGEKSNDMDNNSIEHFKNDIMGSDLSSSEQDSSNFLKKQQNLESQRKNPLKFVCKGHYDSIRSVKFLNDNFSLISASDDGTIILWDLSGDVNQTKGFMSEFLHNDVDKDNLENEVEPKFIFRGHLGPVLRLCIIPTTSQKENGGESSDKNPLLFLSCGLDGKVRSWRYPKISDDEDNSQFENKEQGPIFHDNCQTPIWAMDVHPSGELFVTANALGKVNFWNIDQNSSEETISTPRASLDISEICSKNGINTVGRPSSVIFIPDYYFPKNSVPSESIFVIISTTKGYLIIVDVNHTSSLTIIQPFPISQEDQDSENKTMPNDSLGTHWSRVGIHCMAFQSPIAITNLVLGHEDGFLRLIDLSKIVSQFKTELLDSFKDLGSLQDYSNGQISRYDSANAITDIDMSSTGLNLVYCDDKNWFKLVNFNKSIVKSSNQLTGDRTNLSISLHKNKPYLATGLSNCVINVYNHELVSS